MKQGMKKFFCSLVITITITGILSTPSLYATEEEPPSPNGITTNDTNQ